jgi:hypothetical protein
MPCRRHRHHRHERGAERDRKVVGRAGGEPETDQVVAQQGQLYQQRTGNIR